MHTLKWTETIVTNVCAGGIALRSWVTMELRGVASFLRMATRT